MSDICGDNRFELIEKYKQMLIENTNIEMAKDEMAVIDNILFRFWQMNWLDKLEQIPSAQPETHEERTETHACDCISRKAAIDADGLDEEIRCEMCKNPMHTDRGCDGNCKYDEILYEKIIQILNKRITPLPPAQPVAKDINVPIKDCISRQAAIDALDKRFDSIPMEQTTEILLLQKDLRELPPAQPETHDERMETHACDLISRQAAIDAVQHAFDKETILNNFVRKVAIDALKAMPSAQPEVLARGEGELIAQPEIVRCKDCVYWVAHDKRCVYLNHGFAPNMWCCHGRRADG